MITVEFPRLRLPFGTALLFLLANAALGLSCRGDSPIGRSPGAGTAELPGLTTSADLPPFARSALGRGTNIALGPEAAPASDVGERPPSGWSLWAALGNGLFSKRVTSALQPATLSATTATAIALNREYEHVNSTAENMAYSRVHSSHERTSLEFAGKQNLNSLT